MSEQTKKPQPRLQRNPNNDFSGRGEVIYFAARDADDKFVVVEADGVGGAIAKVVEGNYPIDFFTKYEKSFSKETAALKAAGAVTDGDAAEILT